MRIRVVVLLPMLVLSLSLSLTAQNYSTRGEIYDYEIGDEFHIYEYAFANSGGGYMRYRNDLVTDKFFSSSSDTVYYTVYSEDAYNEAGINEWVYNNYYTTIYYTMLDSLYFADSVYSDSNYNSRKISYKEDYITPTYEKWRKYVDGCGKAYDHYEFKHWQYGYVEAKVLVYFKKGTEVWGTPNPMVSISESPFSKDSFWIFPNPARDRIQLSVDNNVIVEKMRIYDQMGKMILTVSSNYKNIDVSDLNPGMYIVEIITNQGRVCRKLVVE